MAHFYGEIKGSSRTEATRCGTKSSGIYSHVRSWNKGVEVYCKYDEHNKKNIFKVYMTGGSSNCVGKKLLIEFEEELR